MPQTVEEERKSRDISKYFQVPQAPSAISKTPPSIRTSGDLSSYFQPVARRLPAPPESPSPIFEPAYRWLAGKTAAEKYDEWTRGLDAALPQNLKQGQPDYARRVTERLVRAAPEVLDFAASPFGMALIGAHFHPATLPFAVAADFGLTVYQALKTIPSVMEAAESREPEKVADAIKDVAFTFASAKGMRRAAGTAGFVRPERADPHALIERLRTASPDEKLTIFEELSRPATRTERIRQRAYSLPLVRDLASMLEYPKPKLLQAATALVDDRVNYLNVEEFKANSLAYEMKKEVPPEHRDVRRMGYVIQGEATPEQVGLSPAARRFVERVRDFHEDSDRMLRKAYGNNISLQEARQYLSQIWDFRGTDDRTGFVVARRLMRDPFLQQRKIASYKQGIEEHGLKPLYDDVADIVVARHRAAAQAIANQNLANTLRDMGLLLSEEEAESLGLTRTWKLATQATPLNRATYAGKGKRGETILAYRPVRVHPDVEMAVNAVFGEPYRSPLFGAMERLRSFGKQQGVMYSLFHHWALSEQAHAIYATRGLRGIPEALRGTFAFNPDFYRGLKSGIWEVAKKETPHDPPIMRMRPEVVSDWLSAGLEMRSGDAETAMVKALRSAGERNGPLGKTLKAPLRWIGNVDYVFNRSLWDYYMQGQMLHAAEHVFGSERARLPSDANPQQILELRKAVAKHVNNAFGAVNLERLLVSPRGRQLLNFALFAPVWTLSNLRILSAGFENEASSRLTRRWVAGAATSWFLTTQMANYALTSWYGTEDKHGRRTGHFTFDNPGAPLRLPTGQYVPGVSENALNISAGYNPDGSQRYIRFGKGFREPFLWVTEPFYTLGGKLSRPLRFALAFLTGHEPGSGYEVVDPRAATGEQAAQKLSLALDLIAPFAAEDTIRALRRKAMPELFPEGAPTQIMGLPTRKGFTPSRAVDAYEAAMEANRMDLARIVLETAARNNIPAAKVLQGYRSKLSRRERTARGPTVRYDVRGTPVRAAPPSTPTPGVGRDLSGYFRP